MKLVLDKFLWIGFIIMGYGVWRAFSGDFTQTAIWDGATWFITGAVVLVLFVWLIVREYEIIK